MDKKQIYEKIQRLRKQIVIHSTLYYFVGQPIWNDFEFDAAAYELVRLQKENPQISSSVEYEYKYFKDFDGSTGFNLPIWTEDARQKALWLINLNNKYKNGGF